MIASKPVRLISLAIVALVVIVGVRGIVGGFAFGGDLLDTRHAGSDTDQRGQRTAGVVAYVLDGDTVQVDLRDGSDVRVRFLGINAPEIPHPDKRGKCYGAPSTRHLRQLLPVGTQVTLVSDPTQDDVDTFGRWLRYVEAGGRDIGRAQIRSGAATARGGPGLILRHADYEQAELQARAGDAGMWSVCS